MAKKPTYEQLEQRVKELETGVYECVEAQKSALKREDRFRTLADFSYDWIYWIAPDGSFLYMSPSCERITGRSPNEFVKDPGLLEVITHPDDRASIATHIKDELEMEGLLRLDFRVLTKSGDEKWIAHICQQVYGADGTSLGRRANNRDVTDKRMAEEALRLTEARYKGVFENTINGIAVYKAVKGGKDFVIVDFNKSGERIDKFRRQDLIGRSVVDAFPAIKDFGLFDVLKRVWTSGKAEHFPVSFYKDERIVGWRDNFVYKLPSGEIVAVYSDETQRKQAEDALQSAHEELYSFSQELEKKVEERTKELEEKSRQLIEAERLAAVGQIANRVAHELRNPLTVVGGFARRMDEKMADKDPNKKYLRIILSEIEVLETKVSEIIDLRNEKYE